MATKIPPTHTRIITNGWFNLTLEHCNETYTVVPKDNTTDFWRRI